MPNPPTHLGFRSESGRREPDPRCQLRSHYVGAAPALLLITSLPARCPAATRDRPQAARTDGRQADGRGTALRAAWLRQSVRPGHLLAPFLAWRRRRASATGTRTELRHSGASLMLAQGTPLHVVSEVLGHASIAITKDIYGHLLEGGRRAATEAISSALLEKQIPVAPKDAEDTG